MEVDSVQPSSLDTKQQQPQAEQPDVDDDLEKTNLMPQDAQKPEAGEEVKNEITAMQSEDPVNEKPAKDALTTIPTSELDALYARMEAAKQELAQARQRDKQHAAVVRDLKSMEHERDRYRATVLSLAYQNKVLNDELNRSRKGLSGREEKYVDARLQIQDLREALALKEKEVEELKSARDYMPTSDKDLHEAYLRMRDVFENLRSTLSCSLCYELFKPGDVTTLECGHTMCRHCLKQWNDSHVRLYNLATTPDCPECRQPGKHYVKVYLLEEVVRVVDRLERLEADAEAMKQADRKAALEIEKSQQQPTSLDPEHMSSEVHEDTDDEAEEILANPLGK